MKYILLSSFLLFAHHAFSQSIERSVFSSFGSEISVNNYQLNQTIGEPVIGIASNAAVSVYSGFQQVFETVSSILQLAPDASVRLFPNPNNGAFNITSEYQLQSARVFDTSGKLVFDQNMEGINYIRTGLPPGHYFLQALSPEGKPFTLPLIIQ